jgi:hypothetical protein
MNENYNTTLLENENYIIFKHTYNTDRFMKHDRFNRWKYDHYYFNNDFVISCNNKKKFNTFIENLKITKEKLVGNIILEELVQQVFHPNKINILFQKYNFDIDLL